MSDDLKSKLQLDASQTIAEFGKVEAAAKRAEKAGNSTTGGMASGLKAASAEVDKHNASVGKMVDKYRQLEGARKFFDKQPAALKDIDKQQVSILKNLEKQAKSEQELTRYMDARFKLQEKMQKSAEQYSAHSQRQFGQLQGLAMLGGGMALNALGGLGRSIYGQGVGAYNSLNDKYQMNQGLTQSQQALQAARLNVGGSLAGYQGFKNNLQAKLLNSSIAGPLAMFGDLAGFGAQAGGGLLQAAGILKTLGLTNQGISGNAVGMGGKALTSTPGLLGLLGPAAAVYGGGGAVTAGMFAGAFGLKSLLTGSTNVGADIGNQIAQINPFSSDREKGQAKGKELLNNSQIQAKFANLTPEQKKAQTGALDKEIELYEDLQAARGNEKKFAEQLSKLKKYRASQGMDTPQDLINKLNSASDTEQIIGQADVISRAYGGKGAQGNGLANFKAALAGPVMQLQIQRMQNQRSDFFQDIGIQQQVAARQYARGQQDIARSNQYTKEDYSVAIQKINVNRARAAEDYNLQIQKIDLDTYRKKRDLAIQDQRFQQDQQRQSRILNEDFYRDQSRRNEKYNIDTSRVQEDYTRNTSRLNEDYTRSTTRLTEDTNRDRLRADQDYSRSSVELSRNAARSMQDLNKSYHDSVLSILAPGLANSKMMQLFRLRRDYNIQAGRIGEDTQFARQGLELGYGRQKEDISRGYTRGMEDANREKQRAQEDLDREKKRAEADLAREKLWAEQDAIRNKARQEEQMSIDALRQSQDQAKAAIDLAKDSELAKRDANIAYTRAMEDAARDEADATRQKNRALAENQVALDRLTEDYKTQTAEFAKAIQRFNRDWDITIKETSQNLAQEFGVAAGDIEKLYKQALDGITTVTAAVTSSIQQSVPDMVKGWTDALSGKGGNGGKSAAFGEWDTGQGGPYQLHPGEMVVPKSIADALRGLPGGPGGSAGGIGRQRSDEDMLLQEQEKTAKANMSNYAPQPGLNNGYSGGAYAPMGNNVQITIQPGAVTVGGGTMSPTQVQQMFEKHLNNFRNEIQQSTGKQINFASSAGF